jgi:integrase
MPPSKNSKAKRGPVHVARSGNVRVSVYRYGGGRHCVAWTPGRGLRQKRETFPTLAAAKARAEEVALAIESGRGAVLELSGANVDGYIHAMRLLQPLGVSLPVAIEEYVAWKTRASLLKKLSGAEIHARLVASVSEVPPRTPGEYRYRQGLRNDLARFIAAHPQIEHVTAQQIRDYLRALGVGPRRRDNVRDSIVRLFRFAKTKDGGELFSMQAQTEAELVNRLNAPTAITTYTSDELTLLLKFVSERWKPWLAIAAFAGLRPTEILRLSWSALKWSEKPAPVIALLGGKRTPPRRAEFGPTLRRWLIEYRGAVGMIYGARDLKTEGDLLDELSHETKRLSAVMTEQSGAPWKWQPDALRHSYGSYRYAQARDFVSLASWMGNSVQTIKRRYYDSKSEEDGDAWFGVQPEHTANVVQGHFKLA